MKRLVISCHFMPWEIDYALISFTQLRRSRYYLPDDVEIFVSSALNLSDYGIDWGESKIQKEYFIQKYETLLNLLDCYSDTSEIYTGDEKYGHLDLQKKSYKIESDYYLNLCPDIYFSEHALPYIIHSAGVVTNDTFLITPQICTLWDSSWDVLVNTEIGTLPYDQWQIKRDVYDIDNYLHHHTDKVSIRPTSIPKWAGWFDLFNNTFVERFGEIPEEWCGYGAWDLYTMIVTDVAKRKGYDFQQYILDGQIIFPRDVGPLAPPIGGCTKYYKDFLKHKPVDEQRDQFNSELNYFIEKKLSEL